MQQSNDGFERIWEALDAAGFSLDDLLDAFGPRAALARRVSLFEQEVHEIQRHRSLVQSGALLVDRHKEGVEELVRTPHLLGRFIEHCSSYEQRWKCADAIDWKAMAASLERADDYFEKVVSLLKAHPYGQVMRPYLAFPLAALVDIANRSSLSPYQAAQPAVTTRERLMGTSFVTLTHSIKWLSLMGEFAAQTARRLQDGTQVPDLLMIGDGSGALGASMAKAIHGCGIRCRVIHVDISEAMLGAQRLEYEKVGVPSDLIVSLHGSLRNIRSLIDDNVPDLANPLVVLQEVFDDLRTHGLYVEGRDARELYGVVNLESRKIEPQAFVTDERILSDICSFFPFLSTSNPRGRLHSFSPELVLALRDLLSLSHRQAIYIGDYFSMDIATGAVSSQGALPYRVHGRGVNDASDPFKVFEGPCIITSDVLPAMLHLAPAFGGEVETLLPQEQFLARFDPSLPAEASEKLRAIAARAHHGYSRASDFLTDYFEVSPYNPGYFAATVVKGV